MSQNDLVLSHSAALSSPVMQFNLSARGNLLGACVRAGVRAPDLSYSHRTCSRAFFLIAERKRNIENARVRAELHAKECTKNFYSKKQKSYLFRWTIQGVSPFSFSLLSFLYIRLICPLFLPSTKSFSATPGFVSCVLVLHTIVPTKL